MSIFIFHRDLSIVDNKGLNFASTIGPVTPIFVFDSRQIEKNEYFSSNSFQFMLESLEDLESQIQKAGGKLFFLKMDNYKVFNSIGNQKVTNADYTEFSEQRDSEIKDIIRIPNYTIFEEVVNGSGNFYQVFTPFYNKVVGLLEKSDDWLPFTEKLVWNNVLDKNLKKFQTSLKDIKKFIIENKDLAVNGGRKRALKIINNISDFKNYGKTRDFPMYNTTMLSPYIKFGCVSMREIALKIIEQLGYKHELLRQIIWHDFYAQLFYGLGEKRTLGGGNMQNKKLKWSKNYDFLENWKNGTTGVPLVDAAMRQLNTTGFMHNRCRMIVSNFLVFILRIDWHEGEKYFAQKLVDYDVASNNGNWQWNTGVGGDRTPYVRIFNPYASSKKYDPDCEYIYKWVPELKNVPPKMIHTWDKNYGKYSEDYYDPIVDYESARKAATEWYKNSK